MKSMNDLILHFLQDMYDAEKRSLRGMARMGKAAENPELQQAILEHRDQSQGQLQRLEQVFEAIGKRPRAKTCAAMVGLSTEVEEAIKEGEKGPVLDAALVASAQAIEHYEIARYGAMAAWARTMGMSEAAGLLEQTLAEEKASDQRLNELAERTSNPDAASSGAEDDEPAEEESIAKEEEAPPPQAARRRAAATRAPASGRKPAEKPPARAPDTTKPATRRGASRK